MKFVISSLDTNFHTREFFNCGKLQLNDYLKTGAGQDAKRGYSKTFVATCNEIDDKEVVGYYSTSACSIEFENIPENISKRLPKYPAPAMLIRRLAVDNGMRGQRLGETLLMHDERSSSSCSFRDGYFCG